MFEVPGVVAYFVLIAGTGMRISGSLGLDPESRLAGAFIFGSIAAGLAGFAVAQGGVLYPGVLIAMVGGMAAATLWAGKRTWESIRDTGNALKVYLFGDSRYRVIFVVAIVVIAVWLLAMALAPPRSADAMRYHLAQIKDWVWNHGFVFRPYYHYNFPVYFSVLFLPVYAGLGGTALQVAVLMYFALAVAATLLIARDLGVRNPRLLLFLIVLTPLAYHEAHTVTNGWVLVSYVLAGMYFLVKPRASDPRVDVLAAFLSLGFAMGVKYQAVLFIPWFLVLAWGRLEAEAGRRIAVIAGALAAAAAVASPFLVRNTLNLGNPFWPLLTGVFGSGDEYLNLVSTAYSKALAGRFDSSTLIEAAGQIALHPQAPVTMWILALLGAIWARRTPLAIGLGMASFFAFWWALQPRLIWRFSLYVLPIGAIAVVLFRERLRERGPAWGKWACDGILAVTIAYGAVLGGVYSADYLKSHVTNDPAEYHRATWFYKEYEWINANLPPEGRLLVIVYSGHTYYLDRPYLRADPYLSGLIDWRRVATAADMDRILKRHAIDYVLYEDRDWSEYAGGREMGRIMGEYRGAHGVSVLWERSVHLYTSRLRGTYEKTKVSLIDVRGRTKAAARGRRTGGSISLAAREGPAGPCLLRDA